jgi:hypothetical protein
MYYCSVCVVKPGLPDRCTPTNVYESLIGLINCMMMSKVRPVSDRSICSSFVFFEMNFTKASPTSWSCVGFNFFLERVGYLFGVNTIVFCCFGDRTVPWSEKLECFTNPTHAKLRYSSFLLAQIVFNSGRNFSAWSLVHDRSSFVNLLACDKYA